MPTREQLWTLDELGAQVALALSVDYEGSASGRVRDIPDPRTIRYYTTLGLVDRAAEMRGRTALYRQRHLMQLVAIKRLQARGLTLVQIQERLLGISAAALAQLAKLPGEMELGKSAPSSAASETETAEAFWKRTPAEPASPAPPAVAPVSLKGIELDENAALLLAAARTLEPDDIEAIRAAALPLLKLLRTRRLLTSAEEREPS
jgi:DNA-binding transcriptional MerR regulator